MEMEQGDEMERGDGEWEVCMGMGILVRTLCEETSWWKARV